jgi:hypothetical protein
MAYTRLSQPPNYAKLSPFFLYNWLRVSDTAERSQVDQRVRHQLHGIVPLLDTFIV